MSLRQNLSLVPILGAVLLTASSAWATGEAINGFPNWEERVMHEWTNRARCDPQVEMLKCGAACGEGACYTTASAPVSWSEKLNHAARFHSDNMGAMGFFSHSSACTLVPNLDALYPGSCRGAAACACVGGVAACNPTCTGPFQRIPLFGASGSGEIIASGGDPDGAFYQWLFEGYNKPTCGYDQGPPTNGHRYNILMAGPSVGYGAGAGPSVGDFGGGGSPAKLVSGAHYPRQAASVEAWANWYDAAGPSSALVNVDGTCTPMTLGRGTVTNGAYAAALTGVGSGCHRYFFLFTDATKGIVTYPTTGSLGIGAGACADWDSTRPSTGAGCECTPQCAGKTCGDDACGGSCGNCAGATTCQAGQCVGAADAGPPPVNDSGAPPPKDAGPPRADAGVDDELVVGRRVAGADLTAPQGCACDVAGPRTSASAGWSAALGGLGLLGALGCRRRARRPRRPA